MKYALILAVIALSFAGGWQLRAITAQRDLLNIHADYANQLAAAQQQARKREQVLQQHMQEIQDETQQKLDQIRVLERAAADNRVRELAQNYAAGSSRSDSTAATRCHAERTRARVLAELLADLDQLAAIFASEADRRRISGLACEKAYKTLQSR